MLVGMAIIASDIKSTAPSWHPRFMRSRIEERIEPMTIGKPHRLGNLMEVQYVILARYAEMLPDGTHSIVGAGMDVVATDALPFVAQSVFVVAKILLDREDIRVRHTLQFRRISPSGDEIALSDEMTIAELESLPPDREFIVANVLFGLRNLPFETAGAYRFRLYLDGALARELRFRVDSHAHAAPASGEGA